MKICDAFGMEPRPPGALPWRPATCSVISVVPKLGRGVMKDFVSLLLQYAGRSMIHSAEVLWSFGPLADWDLLLPEVRSLTVRVNLPASVERTTAEMTSPGVTPKAITSGSGKSSIQA